MGTWRRTASAAAAVTASMLCAGAADAAFSFNALGYLPSSPAFNEALAVSDVGRFAAGYNYSGVDRQAVRWSGTAASGLGDLEGVQYRSTAFDINADGSVVVGEASAVFNGSTGRQAFRWQNGVMTGLGSLGSAGGTGVPGSSARAVNADGTVVVGYSTAPGAQSQMAFRWTGLSGMAPLGDLAGGQIYSGAHAVSADGATVAGVSISGAGFEAFRWTSSGGMVGLGDFGGGDFHSESMGISADGSVVVGFGHTIDGRRPFRWQNGVMLDLGNVPGGPIEGIAYDVSADGAIIVGGGNNAAGLSPHTAFIWDAQHGIRNLRDVMVNELGLSLGGWTIYNAYDISADGTTVVGNGLNPSGQRQAWIAVIPEPAMLSLIIAIPVLLARRGRRRSPLNSYNSGRRL